jgi:hypothetical protein
MPGSRCPATSGSARRTVDRADAGCLQFKGEGDVICSPNKMGFVIEITRLCFVNRHCTGRIAAMQKTGL